MVNHGPENFPVFRGPRVGDLLEAFLRRQIREIGIGHLEPVEQAREATLAAGVRRVRPCLMTTATTILFFIQIQLSLIGSHSLVFITQLMYGAKGL